VAGTDVILAFWDGTMCCPLVHKLGREQRNTTNELLDIATQHASGEVAVSGGWAAPTKATIKSARKGTKGGKKGQKRRPHHFSIMAGNSGKEADNSGEVFVAIAKHDFKWKTQSPKDHFEKLLEATCPHHQYPVKHNLKDCTMMKKIHDVRGCHQRQQAGRGPRREECDAHSWGSGRHDNLWLT
jgi:hypothetical protein